MRLVATVLSLTLFLCATAGAQPPPPPARPGATPSKDAVLIVGVTPVTFVDGVETDVEVTIAYQLDAKPEGVIELTSNTLRPQGFSPFTSQRVAQGSGTITVRGKLTPRYWTSNIVPKIGAFLVVPGEELTQRRALASDHKAITVTLRPNPSETYAVNPNPSVVYEDGLRIKSITPLQFVEGQPVDVEVVVSYELLSRETGELALGFSHGRGASFPTTGRVQVKAGKGETVLRGRVTPQRTGALPFMKVQVNLSEFPRRTRTVALATDGETVEVR